MKGFIIAKRGLALVELPADNFAVPTFPGLIVNDCYWRWPERDQAGNTIDFFVQVLGLSFHEDNRRVVNVSRYVMSIVFDLSLLIDLTCCKHRLTVVAAIDHMINRPGIFQPQLAGHARQSINPGSHVKVMGKA